MLTPVFELTQDTAFVTFHIKAPYAKISDTEIYVDGPEFKFYSKPYYLRLNLPGDLVEDGREKAKYDSDKGAFIISISKQITGQQFEGLDMLTKLLAPANQPRAKAPLIEVLGNDENGNKAAEDDQEEEEFDWQVEQIPYDEPTLTEGPKYGFANQRSGVFKRLQSEMPGLIDLPNADDIPASERRELRRAQEDEAFSDDHYCADLYEEAGGMIPQVIAYRAPWDVEYTKRKPLKEKTDNVALTEEEKEKMRKLPRKEYLLDASATKCAFLSLVDIIYAYAYNHRTTEGENTVESHWTICKLSPSLSWLDPPSSVHDAAVAGVRRSLCYPLYRHWQLSMAVLQDTACIFTLGRGWLLKCLLEIENLFSESDPCYVLNNVYIIDYCVWIQSASKKQLASLAKELRALSVTKADMDFDLEELESAAAMVNNEEETDVDVTAKVANLQVKTGVMTSRQITATSQSTPADADVDGDIIDLTKRVAKVKVTAGGPGAGNDQKGKPSDSGDGKDGKKKGGNPATNGAGSQKLNSNDPTDKDKKVDPAESSDSDTDTESDTGSEDEYDIELMEKVKGNV